jgi:ATP-dependent Clp protease ATP-binding subunit ClpC
MERTPRCQKAIDHAKQSFGRFGQSPVGSAHLVLGLLTLTGGVGDTVLKRAGLSTELVERFLSSRAVPSEGIVEHEGGLLSGSAIEVITRAEAEAAAVSHTYLGVEHLTMALLAEEHGEAAELFASLRIDRDKLRQTILDEMR